jgi:hypothetical protein
MKLFDAKQWRIGLAIDLAIKIRETLQMLGVKTMALFNNLQAAI